EKYDEGRYIGHTDVSLSQTGKDELTAICDEYGYPEVESVFSSPLKRCTETAGIIYPDKTPIIIEDLSEMNFGEFEGKTAEELKSNEAFAGWLEGKTPLRSERRAKHSAAGYALPLKKLSTE
ncbi:MAG: histidine phosphatase family protein, partial [Clostridia bacterium]|nr:histidine phosphatase family protein [Clostridia bacterium]